MARSTFTQETADEICEWISKGKSLRSYCGQEGKPDQTTVLRWCGDNEEFRKQYAQAREAQADHYADEIVEIADSDDAPDKARVRIDARKWVAGKLRPKKYGEKVDVDHSGEITVKFENADGRHVTGPA